MRVGGDVTMAVDRPCSSFALVRYGTATHALDTDQRRVPLTPRPLNPAATPPLTADSAAASGGRRLTQVPDYNAAGDGAVLTQGYQSLPDGSLVQVPVVQNPAASGSAGEFATAGEFAPGLAAPPPIAVAPAPEATAAGQPPEFAQPALTQAPPLAPAPLMAAAPAPEASTTAQPAPQTPLPAPAPEPLTATPVPAPKAVPRPAPVLPAPQPPVAVPAPVAEQPVADLAPAPEPSSSAQPAATPPLTDAQERTPCGRRGGACYSLPLPADPGILLPGYWMLFAMDADGVPSKAVTMHVSAAS